MTLPLTPRNNICRGGSHPPVNPVISRKGNVMGKIFYIMGKSASGKDSIYRKMLEKEELNLQKMVLYTTRPIRQGEVDGNEYFFVDNDAFKQFKNTGKVIEARSYDTVHGIWTYFTADDGKMDLDKYDYICIGTLESYRQLADYYGENSICPIYIEVEDGERLRRAIKREGKQEKPVYEEVCRRFLADSEDFSEDKISATGKVKRFLNHDKEGCRAEVGKYIKSVVL